METLGVHPAPLEPDLARDDNAGQPKQSRLGHANSVSQEKKHDHVHFPAPPHSFAGINPFVLE